MADKAQGPEGQKVFRGELFGFNRVEVLSYIERISAANAEKAKALGETIEKLQKELDASLREQSATQEKLSGLQQEHKTVLTRTKDVCAQLETEKARAETAVRKAEQLQQELRKASNDASAFRQRLLEREKELEQLRQNNTGLTEKIAKLEESIHLYESKQKAALGEREQLAAQAKLVLEKAKVKADDVLKEAQAKAQVKLDQADSQAALIVAKANEEKTMLKAKMSESADSIAASVVVLKSQLEHVNEEIVSASEELLKATDGISAALNNTQRDLENLGVKMQNYPQQTDGVPHYVLPKADGAKVPFKQNSLSDERDKQAPFDEARYRAALQKIRQEEEENRYYDELARADLRRARSAAQSVSDYGQRNSRRGETDYQSSSQVQERMNRSEQTMQYPYDRQQVVQQPATGHLHRPTAMPFAPFDDSVPHTPPYPEKREIQPQWAEEYVPSPTPVAPVASFSQPFVTAEEPSTQRAPSLEDMPKMRRTVSSASVPRRNVAVPQEPVIIPYDAPIPQMVEPSSVDPEKPSSEVQQKTEVPSPETTLSDALLENLNQLLNGK